MQLQFFDCKEHTDILNTQWKRFVIIIITLCNDNNIVLTLIFFRAPKYRYESFKNITLSSLLSMKNGFNKVQKTFQGKILPILKDS